MPGPENTRLVAWRDSGTALDSPLATVVAPPLPPEQSDWQRYVMAVMRHKWLVLGVTLLGTVAGLVATRFLDPRYSAKAILWVETAVGRDRGVRSDEMLDSRGWVELVTSNAVLDSVVKERRLFLYPQVPADAAALSTFQITDQLIPGQYRFIVDKAGRAWRLEMEDGTVVGRGRVGQPVGTNVGFDWTPAVAAVKPGTAIDFRVSALADASARLATSLKARLDPAGNFLRLQLKGTNPAATAATLNTVAARIVVVATEMKRRKFQDLAGVLEEQYTHAQHALSDADVALRDFRVRTAGSPALGQTMGGGLSVEGSGLASQLRNEVDQLNRDRRALDQAAAQAAANGVAVEQWTGIAAVAYSPALKLALEDVTKKQSELRNLRYQYTPDAAPVRQVMSDLEVLERQVVPSLARQLSKELAARAGTMAPRADTVVRTLRAAPNTALEQDRLVREQQMAEDQFRNVGKEYDAAKLALISSLSDVRVLDSAVEPRRPASDYAPLLILLAAVASFGVAVLGVTIRDRMDPKVRYPEQITGQMRLQILGAVPHVSWRVSANGDGPAQVIEALRGLRLRVLHAHSSGGPLMLTITSPGIGDGKSFVSLNLALSFADAGYRTLLVDGDTRRGVQHKALKTPSTPGLTDVVAGRVPIETALRETSYPGLTFLSSGTRMQRAPERLLSQSMRDLMNKLRSMYDVVIVDSPPLGAGADPLVLGTLTENVLLVMRTGQSDLKMAGTKLEVLNSLPVRVIGAVLNDVRSTGVYRYYMYSTAEYELVDDEGPTREALPSVLGGRT